MPNLWYLCTQQFRPLNPSLSVLFVILEHPRVSLDDVSEGIPVPHMMFLFLQGFLPPYPSSV